MLLGKIDPKLCDPVVTAKTDKLKLAKAEAEREIKAYKSQREEQYQKRMADVSTSQHQTLPYFPFFSWANQYLTRPHVLLAACYLSYIMSCRFAERFFAVS